MLYNSLRHISKTIKFLISNKTNIVVIPILSNDNSSLSEEVILSDSCYQMRLSN